MTTQATADNSEDDVFVEQAEYIDPASFLQWTTSHPNEKQILQKLSRGGAKLLVGPRGCGKTTLLLKAFHVLIGQKNGLTLPVYVNFKASLRLEPLYKRQANAMYWFNQWMLFKCYAGLLGSLKDLGASLLSEFKFTRREAVQITQRLEMNADLSQRSESQELTIEEFSADVERALNATGRTRCVLFLDDAAHAFSPDQQRDFFDFFRRIKSQRLAPKAAIYPGVTIFPPTFHIGHDAEEIDVWLDPYDENYLPFMRGLLRQRLPSDVFDALVSEPGLLDLVCFAAFGMPRTLLNIVRGFYEVNDSEGETAHNITFTSKKTLAAIRTAYQSTVGIYSSLQDKLPMYRNFVVAGETLLSKMVLAVKAYNKDKPEDRQSVTVAMTSISPEVERVLGFLQYAGLVRYDRPVSRGVKGVFQLYNLHAGGLIERNALLAKKSVRAEAFSAALRKRNAHEFTRVTAEKLLGVRTVSEALQLALPPCLSCGTARADESARFCLQCGNPLTAVSTFNTLIKKDIAVLPLTDIRVAGIKANSRIQTVGDILLDHEHRELRNVPGVGPYWAKRIFFYAEEFIA